MQAIGSDQSDSVVAMLALVTIPLSTGRFSIDAVSSDLFNR
jgi:hypothetical protein